MAHRRLPSSFKALILVESEPESLRQSLHYDVRIVDRPIPALEQGQVLVKINAAGFNHREVGSGHLEQDDIVDHPTLLFSALDSEGSVPGNRTRSHTWRRRCRYVFSNVIFWGSRCQPSNFRS